ncbi:MAG: hypothetical protein PHQ12_02645 [Chthoniobacteraceae bacterium]|nr:hypothetical protein [Chthoniobacteraceae bacterium]
MPKHIPHRFALICAVAFGLCALSSQGGEGLSLSSLKSGDEGTTARQDGMTVGKGFVALHSIRLDRANVESFREIVKKFDEWSKIAVNNKLERVSKPLTSGKLTAVFSTDSDKDDDGKPVIRCFLALQGTEFGTEELHEMVKSLDLIPELDRQIQKADKLLK